jgi:hypothetical protein
LTSTVTVTPHRVLRDAIAGLHADHPVPLVASTVRETPHREALTAPVTARAFQVDIRTVTTWKAVDHPVARPDVADTRTVHPEERV